VNAHGIELKGIEKFTHFSPFFFVLIFPVMGVVLPWIYPGGKDITLFWVIGIPVAFLAYWWQKRQLRFQVIHTNGNAEGNYHSIMALAHHLHWKVNVHRQSEFIQATVQGFPKTMASWGERVTVAFLSGDVFVNSICDPAKHSSITAFGRNIENVRAVAKAVREPNQALNSDPAATII